MLAAVLELLRDDLGANVTLALNPAPGSDLRAWTRTSTRGEAVVFGALSTRGRVRVELRAPSAWRVARRDAATVDLDGFAPNEVDGDVDAAYEVDAIFLRGAATSPRARRDAGFGPVFGGARACATVNGREVLAANGEFVAAVADFSAPIALGASRDAVRGVEIKMFPGDGRTNGPHVERIFGERDLVPETSGDLGTERRTSRTDLARSTSFEVASYPNPNQRLFSTQAVRRSISPRALGYRGAYVANCSAAPRDDGAVHVFSVASGLVYERLLRIMMGSAVLATSKPVHFWLLGEFLSPTFDAAALEDALGCTVTLLDSPPWPEYLRDHDGARVGIRGDKQRLIWAYKILFLDTLFHGRTDRLVFVDADQVVFGDLAELTALDLGGAPYAFAPFCAGDDANPATAGHRFWESGFWKAHLGDTLKYHISALFVVDVDAFRSFGDGLRTIYRGLAQDPDSLANLDQDLPNYLQGAGIPIHSLDQNWLFCETWCAPERRAAAKSVDMCQNPLTKEHKLDMARRVAGPLWTALDDFMAALAAGDAPRDFRAALAPAARGEL